MKNRIKKFHKDLVDLHYPLYGMGTLYVNLILVVYSIYGLMNYRNNGEKGEVSTLIGHVFTEDMLASVAIFNGARILCVIFTALWALHILVPYTSWLTYIFYTICGSLFFENIYEGNSHRCHIINAFLLIHVLWYHFYGKIITAKLRKGNLWSSRVMPYWVHFLQVGIIGIAYTFSGLQKLIYGGIQWADGLNVQLWLYLKIRQQSYLGDLLINHRDITFLLSWMILIAQCSAILGLFLPRYRIILGIALVIFHIGEEFVLGWKFYGNIIFVVLAYLPFFYFAKFYTEKRFQNNPNALT